MSNQLDSEALVKESTTLEKYLKNRNYNDLVEELKALNPHELKERLRKQMSHRQEIMDTKADDADLKQARRRASSLASVYNEQTRMCDKIARFIHLQIKDKE